MLYALLFLLCSLAAGLLLGSGIGGVDSYKEQQGGCKERGTGKFMQEGYMIHKARLTKISHSYLTTSLIVCAGMPSTKRVAK